MKEFVFLMIAVSVIAWFSHIFTCFAEGWWGFLIAGAIMPPIGVFHGIYGFNGGWNATNNRFNNTRIYDLRCDKDSASGETNVWTRWDC